MIVYLGELVCTGAAYASGPINLKKNKIKKRHATSFFVLNTATWPSAALCLYNLHDAELRSVYL